MNNYREAYWDNLKLILIFLVVLGHFILPAFPDGTVTRWIYLFHMPAFVFVSGFFSKSFVAKEGKTYKLLGFLVAFFAFTFCVWVIEFIFTHRISPRTILVVPGAPWYMLTMFFWYLLIPFVSTLAPIVTFPLSVILALLAGFFPECGDFLALSRTIVLFPFFLVGYYFKPDYLLRIKLWMRIVGCLFLIAAACVLHYYGDKLAPFLKVVYASSSYQSLGLSLTKGLLYRSLWFFVSALMTASLICIIPTKRFVFTYIGERTLGIYIVHRLLRDVFKYLKLYRYLGHGTVLLLLCILLSAVVVLISSMKPIHSQLNKIFHLDFLLFKRKERMTQ